MKKYLVLAFASLLFLAGCNTAKIYSVNNRPLTNHSEEYNMDVVADVIMRAAISRNWDVQRVADDEIEATLQNRQHTATVSITFDQQRFSIDYVDSANLKHSGNTIHRNYNRWIHNLENDIRKHMRLMKMGS